MVHGKWSKQQNFQSLQALVPQYYKYGNYLFNKLPFKNSNLQNLDKSINLEDSTECPHKGIIKNDSKNRSLSSHNHQALHLINFHCFYILIVLIYLLLSSSSTFNKSSLFLHTYCFDILIVFIKLYI